MQGNPYQTYQNTQIQTASQGKLIIMLFDGAIKFTKQAIHYIDEKDLNQINYNLVRAQDIVNELKISLNLETGEIAENLYNLYDYIYRRLIEANIKKDKSILDEVARMLNELRETWVEVIKQSYKNTASQEEIR